MNLLLLTFGDNTDNHQQAVFAALSFMRDPHIRRVLVVTDRPDFYRWLSGTERNALLTEEGGEDASGERGMAAAVEILPITAETLSAWQGPQQFFWRIKIQAVAMAVRQYPDQHLLYVDSAHSWPAHWRAWCGSWTRGPPACTASRIAWATATAGR